MVTDSVGAPYVQPEVCTSLACTLTLQPTVYKGPSAKFTTRAFNGGIPGPTLRVAAGQTLRVVVNNALTDVDNSAVIVNNYHMVNSTNLHTHGLHVSAKPPSDDIFIEILPQETYTYIYDLPANHMGGTLWYHSHMHGSGAIQAGGGAAGMLIVEDAPGEVPPEVAQMEEMIMLLQHMDMPALTAIQNRFNTALLQVQGTPSLTVLVNGLSNPVVPMVAGKWYRWRVCFVSIATFGEVKFTTATGTATCEMQLLAKDGIYLRQAPRALTKFPLYSSSRADVAVRCSGSGTLVLAGVTPTITTTVKIFTGDILTIQVQDTGAPAQPDLPTFTVKRPCYLVDTRSLTPDTSGLTLAMTVSAGAFRINGLPWSSSTDYLSTFTTGTLVEVALSGLNAHIFHLHVHPFQLTAMSPFDTTYFQVGRVLLSCLTVIFGPCCCPSTYFLALLQLVPRWNLN